MTEQQAASAVGTWVDDDGRTHYGAADHPQALAYAKRAADDAVEKAAVEPPVVEPSVPDVAPAPDEGLEE